MTSPRLMLIQIRQDAMKEHEYRCVLEKIGLSKEQLVSFDIFERLIQAEDLNGFDGLIIGGSGSYCVSEKQIPHEIEAMEEVIREARRRRLPIIGLCFGHHLIAEALGGEVKQDRERQEVGTFEMSRLPAGDHDPLFSRLPRTFLAQEGHKDHVVRLPPGAVHLVTSPQSPYQAFTFPGEGIYGFQFHPELGQEDVFTRLDYYRHLYLTAHLKASTTDAGASGQDEFQEIMDKTTPTPEAERLLQLFVIKIVMERQTYPALAPALDGFAPLH